MSNKHNNGKGIRLTEEQRRALITMIVQHDGRIDELWEAVSELKLLAIDAGWPVKNAKAWKDSAPKRAETLNASRILRQRFWDALGLD